MATRFHNRLLEIDSKFCSWNDKIRQTSEQENFFKCECSWIQIRSNCLRQQINKNIRRALVVEVANDPMRPRIIYCMGWQAGTRSACSLIEYRESCVFRQLFINNKSILTHANKIFTSNDRIAFTYGLALRNLKEFSNCFQPSENLRQ